MGRRSNPTAESTSSAIAAGHRDTVKLQTGRGEDPRNDARIAEKPVYGSRSATRMPEDGEASGVIVASPPSVAIAT